MIFHEALKTCLSRCVPLLDIFVARFLKDDLNAKAHILEDFENVILPWWETDVINHVVDGKPRFFSVYLID